MNSTIPYVQGNFVDVIFRQVMDNGVRSLSIMLLVQLCVYLSLEKIKDLLKVGVGWCYEKFQEVVTGLLYIGKRVPQKSVGNEYVVSVSVTDKVMQLALGKKIIESSQELHKTFVSTSKYDNVVTITVPVGFRLSYENFDVEFIQNFDWRLELHNNILKNSIVNDNTCNVHYITNMEFHTITDKFSVSFNLSSLLVQGEYYCPPSFCRGYYYALTTYIFYTQSWTTLLALYKFLQCEGSFTFNKKTYRLISADSNLRKRITESLENTLIEKAKVYAMRMIHERNEKALKKFTAQYRIFMENENPHIDVKFTSDVLTVPQLRVVASEFITQQTTSHFAIVTENTDKIAIYKISVEYETVVKSETETESSESGSVKEKKKPTPIVNTPPKPKVVAKVLRQCRKLLKHLVLEKPVKKLLKSYLYKFKHDRAGYENASIPYKGGILLHGAPGCGKTSTITAIATYLSKDIYYIDLSTMSDLELEMCVDHIKKVSRNGAVVIFEDIDVATPVVRRREQQLKESKLTLAFLLNLIDGTTAPEEFIFVITTNHLKHLDPALIRPGRMDICIEIKRCNRYQLRKAYKTIYGKELSPSIVSTFPEYKYSTAEVIMYLFHNTYNDVAPDVLMSKFI